MPAPPSTTVPESEPKSMSSLNVSISQDTDNDSSNVDASQLQALLPPAIQSLDDSSGTRNHTGPARAPSPPKGPRNSHEIGTTIRSKFFQLRWIIVSSFVALPLSILLFFYVYEALVSITPALGPLLFSPSRTLLVITLLSQALGAFILVLFHSVFERLRWQLVSKESGIGLTTFLGLSGGTSFFGVITLFYKGRGITSTFWCAQRYKDQKESG
jgi:hypothetical protein